MYMSCGLTLGCGGPIGDYIGLCGGPMKGYTANLVQGSHGTAADRLRGMLFLAGNT